MSAKYTKSTTILDVMDDTVLINFKAAIPYQAGKWDAKDTYIRTVNTYPIVQDGNGYYFLAHMGEFTGGLNPTAEYAANAQTSKWKKADNFQVVMADITFSKWAKMGSFVFDGDRMMSQFGEGGKTYEETGFVPNIEMDGLKGTAKLGVFSIDTRGQIVMNNPTDQKPRLIFDTEKLPLLDDLKNTTSGSGSANFTSVSLISGVTGTKKITLGGSMNVTKNSSTITIKSSFMRISGAIGSPNSSFRATVHLMRDGVRLGMLGSLTLNPWTENESTYVIPEYSFSGAPSGLYTAELSLTTEGGGSNGSVTARVETLQASWVYTKAGVRQIQFAPDGFMSFFSNNYIHMTESKGLEIGGKTNLSGDTSITGNANMPGVLIAADIVLSTASGQRKTNFKQKWGIPSLINNIAITRSGRDITFHHNIGHTNYYVSTDISDPGSKVELVSKFADQATFNIEGTYREHR